MGTRKTSVEIIGVQGGGVGGELGVWQANDFSKDYSTHENKLPDSSLISPNFSAKGGGKESFGSWTIFSSTPPLQHVSVTY